MEPLSKKTPEETCLRYFPQQEFPACGWIPENKDTSLTLLCVCVCDMLDPNLLAAHAVGLRVLKEWLCNYTIPTQNLTSKVGLANITYNFSESVSYK